MTAVRATWTPGTSLAYQWSADGSPIPGATKTTFTPTAAQLGKVIRVAVTGTKAGYTTVTRTSDPTDAVVAGDLSPTPKPTITGTAKVAAKLTAVPGRWAPGTSLAYQWSADGSPIPGATKTTFTPTAAQLGMVIRVAVTGTKAGYTTVTKTSDPTDPVVAGGSSATSKPSMAGTRSAATPLTAALGPWHSAISLAYQW